MLSGRRSSAEAPRLVLYSRPGCCLCEEVLAGLAPYVRRGRIRLEVVDVSADAALERRHGTSIPVLEHEGRPLAKGRFTAREALRRLQRRMEG